MNMQHEVEERGRRPAGEDARERLLSGLPVTERRLQLAGVSTAVLEGGDGPPIVLLQGEFAAVWMRVIPELVTTHLVIAPDLPGLGASEVADGPPDADDVLTWLDELIEQTCAIPPVLVGKGPGGDGALLHRRAVATDRARAPTRFRRYCFVDLDGVRAEMGERYEWMAAYALDRFRTPSVKAAMRSLGRQLASAIPSGDLDRITVPTTLIWGRHDLGVRLNVAEAASVRYGWPLYVIENARDDPAIERPEAFLEALRAAVHRSSAQVASGDARASRAPQQRDGRAPSRDDGRMTSTPWPR